MDVLIYLLLFPIIWPFISKMIWKHEISWGELGANVGIMVVMIIALFFLSRGVKTHDTELWNGQIVSKHREHGSYVRSYSCHCRQSCSGSGKNRSCHQVCQTCYEDHYTVKWFANTTIGQITLQYYDRTSRSVYRSPDPKHYIDAYVGEPCSAEHGFTNYVKAVPESLFNKDKESIKKGYAGKIPAYPTVHNYYKVIRVLDTGSGLPQSQLQDFNHRLNMMLREIGPSKQANIIAVVTGITDPSYKYAVEASWVGGKKNDIVVFIGVDKQKNITWTDAMTFGLNRGNELMQVKLRDSLKEVGTFDSAKLAETINTVVVKDFKRISMSKFEYLKNQITPPTWLLIIMVIMSVGGTVGLSIYFARNRVI